MQSVMVFYQEIYDYVNIYVRNTHCSINCFIMKYVNEGTISKILLHNKKSRPI